MKGRIDTTQTVVSTGNAGYPPRPMLAPYACRPEDSRGRLHDEPESPTRSPFQRDRDRIIHSGAFRKLKHKTQVFVFHEGDYYRTRLTHSLEVAQIARSLSRCLGLNEDLAEAVALAHDLGHTPFGHAGEEALNAAMADHGGFRHNDHTLRILTWLEQRYAEFDGLNPTWETLEGIAKHNGPLLPLGPGDALPQTIAAIQQAWDLDLDSQPSAEAQIAALADGIAYNNHDIDDGLRAGLFTIDDLGAVPIVGDLFAEVDRRYPGLEQRRLIHESIRRLIDSMVNDVLAETRARLDALAPSSPDDVRRAATPVVGFGEAMRRHDRALREFLFARMYRHFQVNRETIKSRRVVADLFEMFTEQPTCLPTEWQAGAATADRHARARLVADYIAGMTDRYALVEHQRLFDLTPRT